MPRMALTPFEAADWMSLMRSRISSVALAVCWASDLTSEATTAKPLPGHWVHAQAPDEVMDYIRSVA